MTNTIKLEDLSNKENVNKDSEILWYQLNQRYRPKLFLLPKKFKWFIHYLICRKQKSKDKIIYEQGSQAMKKSLDIIKLIKSIKKTKTAIMVLMNDTQKELISIAS